MVLTARVQLLLVMPLFILIRDHLGGKNFPGWTLCFAHSGTIAIQNCLVRVYTGGTVELTFQFLDGILHLVRVADSDVSSMWMSHGPK